MLLQVTKRKTFLYKHNTSKIFGLPYEKVVVSFTGIIGINKNIFSLRLKGRTGHLGATSCICYISFGQLVYFLIAGRSLATLVL